MAIELFNRAAHGSPIRIPTGLQALALAALCLLGSTAPVQAAPVDERQRYAQALQALERDETERFQELATALQHYPLHPYLLHAELSRRLATAGDGEVRGFLQRYPELPVSADLRSRWLRLLARRGRWSDFLNDYRPQHSSELRCLELKARLKTGDMLTFDADSRELWLSGESRPDACDPVFRHWRQQGLLTEELHYERALLAIRAGELRLAEWLSRGLPKDQQDALSRWSELRRSPRSVLPQARHWPDQALNRRMLAEELVRLAGSDADRALHFWELLADQFHWGRQQRAQVERRIHLLRATDYPDDALQRLDGLPGDAVDLQIRQWRVRVALHQGDWNAVLARLDGLPTDEAQRDQWLYWRARALEATGAVDQARPLYLQVASQAHYHGFLAAERLGQPYALCPQLRDADMDRLARLAALPGMRRSIELFHVGQLHDARREWNRVLARLDAEDRRQASLLAASEGWHERAVLTLANAGFLRQYSLRFPLAWREQVLRESARRDLNPSLVHAVMRSESALVVDAISGAGARGLMQLTPDTGRSVARRYGLPAPARGDLLDAEANISLGAAYLDQLYQEFGHPLLVLAAYNAGPEAVKRWQDAGMPDAADVWIETLPYHETREYLPRVLAFATLYDWRRHGRMLPLSLRMPDLSERPGKTDLADRPGIRPLCPQKSQTRLSQK